MRIKQLNSTDSLIWRITHRDNIPWILDNGLHCANSNVLDPNFVTIGHTSIITRRSNIVVPLSPNSYLNNYIPFYFTPFSMMAYNIRTGNDVKQVPNTELVLVVAKLPELYNQGIPLLFTDRNACLRLANFYSDIKDLDKLDWDVLQRRDFSKDPNNPEKHERYQAEALIYEHLTIKNIAGLFCYDDTTFQNVQQHIKDRNMSLAIIKNTKWYFE